MNSTKYIILYTSKVGSIDLFESLEKAQLKLESHQKENPNCKFFIGEIDGTTIQLPEAWFKELKS